MNNLKLSNDVLNKDNIFKFKIDRL